MSVFLAMALAFAAQNSIKLFGVELYIDSSNSQLAQEVLQEVRNNLNHYSNFYDPDCYYKKMSNQTCVIKPIDNDLKSFLNEIEIETKQHFSPYTKSENAKKMDLGGMAQGHVLNQLAQKFPKGWYANFAGDIFIAPDTKTKDLTFITDPLAPNLPYAAVDMSAGWITSSTASHIVNSVRNEVSEKNDFDKIILFASPHFNGARLDAWDTALMHGGIDLLRHLLSLKKYQNQWSYLYFQSNGKVVCASNLDCQFKDPKKRIVKVNFNKK